MGGNREHKYYLNNSYFTGEFSFTSTEKKLSINSTCVLIN